MRILHLLNHTRRLNGHVHATVDLACAQAELGHTVLIGSGGGDFDALLRANGIGVVAVDHDRRPQALPRSVRALWRTAKELRPDVVHAHMMTSALLAWPVCKMLGVPLITTVHNAFERSAILMGLGTRVIAVSGAVAESMAGRGVSRRRLRVVLNGTIGSVRTRGWTAVKEALPSPSIVFVGGQHPRKGLLDLFAAFEAVHARAPDASLFVIGDGPCLADYMDRVSRMACRDRVHFLKGLADPRPHLLGADIFVLPSHADPAPLVLSEAREAGCAIVATDVDGIPELLEGGKAGLLVPPHDPGRLAEALCTLIEQPGELERWRQASQFRIEHLQIGRVAQQTLEVYASARDEVGSGRLARLRPAAWLRRAGQETPRDKRLHNS